MIKTNELPVKTGFASTDSFLVDMLSGTGRLSGAEAANFMQGNIPPATPSAAGLMSAEQVVALNSKATVSNNVTLYVAPDGNDTTGDGTSEKPFATVNRALDELGDIVNECTIVLKTGTYNWTDENWGGDNKPYAMYCNKYGTLAIKGETSDVTVNIEDNYVPQSGLLAHGAVYARKCQISLQNIKINYGSTNNNTGPIQCCGIFATTAGVVIVSAASVSLTINRNNTAAFGARNGGIIQLGTSSSPKVSFIDTAGNQYIGFGVIGGGTIYGGRIILQTGDGLCNPYYGNLIRYTGCIYLPSASFSWGATTEDYIDNGAGLIVR